MRTAIVIGATGLVGSQLVQLLVNSMEFEKVITLTRRAMQVESDKVDNHVVDFDRLAEVSALFKGDTLFSCLGTTRKVAGSLSAQRVVDLDYQHLVAELALQQGVQHYLLVSSSGANLRSRNPYLRMKGELECKISTLSFSRISIFQPSLLLGERQELRLAEKIAGAVLPVICRLPGLRVYRPIQARDVAQKMLIVATQEQVSVKRTFSLDEVFPD